MFKYLCSAVLSLAMAAPSWAGRLQVSPTSFSADQSNQTTAKELWVSNTSNTILRAQIRVMVWSQSDWQEQWEPTTAVLPSPAMVEIKPNDQQLVRIIIPKPLGTGEKTFRVVVDELPGEEQQNSTAQVNFLLRYSIPFFVNPDWSTPKLTSTVEQMDGKWFVVVHNPTNHTIKASQLTASGQSTPLIAGLVGYVLPNAKMRWPLPGPVAGELLVILNEQAQPTVLRP